VIPDWDGLVKAHRKARLGRNPQTGEPIQIKAKTVREFRVAKAAKDAIAQEVGLFSVLCERPAEKPAFGVCGLCECGRRSTPVGVLLQFEQSVLTLR